MQDGVGELVILRPHMATRPEFDQYTVIFFPFDPPFKAYMECHIKVEIWASSEMYKVYNMEALFLDGELN